ncbi:hypothetical protein Tco_0802819 [Tanacetum coccineum]|uniref:DUF4283 domain-containing protein n=1 Tax=Tanacetum coccineum TaxID=301880 RepID=A0ABQ5A2K2_9ASTR
MEHHKGNAHSTNSSEATRVNLFESGVTRDGNPKVSNSSPMISPSTTINVPRELYNIDVAASFAVPLTTVGDLHKLINDIEAGKHDVLLSEMNNDDRMETLDALGTICNSIQADNNNVDSVDINSKSTSYAGAASASAKDQPKVNPTFVPWWLIPFLMVLTSLFLVNLSKRNNWAKHGLKRIMMNSKGFFFFKFDSRAGLEAVLEGGPWMICKSLIIKMVDADHVDVVTIGIPSLSGDGFTKETICVEYEWRPPRCDMCKIFGHVHDHWPKKTTGNSSKKDNLSMSNSFSALNDEEEDDEEEDVENV